mgnify:CR=1 FL=1
MSNSAPQQTYDQYKIRRISWNKQGDIYGITIPRSIALQFEDVKFTASIEGESIILKSGLDIVKLKREMGEYKIEDYGTVKGVKRGEET